MDMEGFITYSSLLIVLIMSVSLDTGFAMPMKSTPMTELKWKNCPGVETKGKLMSAKFNGTMKGPAADLHKGTSVSIDFKFEADVDEANLTSVVAGKVGFLPWVNYPLTNPDGCKDSGLKCPIKSHQTVDLVSVLDVKSFFPSVNVVVRWELKDGANNDVFCVLIPAKVEN